MNQPSDQAGEQVSKQAVSQPVGRSVAQSINQSFLKQQLLTFYIALINTFFFLDWLQRQRQQCYKAKQIVELDISLYD